MSGSTSCAFGGVARWLVIGLLAPATLRAQAPTQPAAVVADGATQDAAPAIAFEVSVVRLNHSGGGGSSSNMNDGRFTASNVTLKNLMEYSAYGLPGPRISGGPKWFNTERFDIEAKMTDADAAAMQKLARDQRRAQSQAMFQQLLADRFKLVAHWETREMPIYALVVGKNGTHMTPSKEVGSGTHTGNGEFVATGVTMEDMARSLTQELSDELGRVIVDKTGIVGKYDVSMKWTPDKGASGEPDAASPDAPPIFTAIQEQVGLKLEPAKGPVQVLVIDRLEMPAVD
jgi:uncharacterized protein (TIGR03435 family)